MSEERSRFGPDWEQPRQEQEEREEASSISTERKEVVGRDGGFVLEENVSTESFLTDGERGRVVSENNRRVRLLDCDCPYDEKVGAVRTVDGRWVCPKHYVGFCGRCQQPLASTIPGSYTYLPGIFARPYHPRCAYLTLEELFFQMRTHRGSITLEPAVLLSYQAIHSQLKQEFGLMARMRRVFSGR